MTFRMSWSVSDVKRLLPNVRCCFERTSGATWGEKHECVVTGRQNTFATVRSLKNPNLSAEFSWITVANAVNTGSTLQA